MWPIIALVGRPNVGKSTLFNRLTKTRDAIVADFPGVTRDRQYGEGRIGEKPFWVIDTGGIGESIQGHLEEMTEAQVAAAIKEADCVFFLVDAKAGLTSADQMIADQLRSMSAKVTVVLNKVDGLDPDLAKNEFFSLGLGEPIPIAALQGRGLTQLIATALKDVLVSQSHLTEEELRPQGTRIAVIGRPNVGKSTLINRMIGEERVMASEIAHTTRDSIYVPFSHQGKLYTLIDTAGMRRRSRVAEGVEQDAVLQTLRAIEAADVVIMVCNARENIHEQDAKLMGWVLQVGRPLVLAINQWDGLDEDQREEVKTAIDRRLQFVDFARRYFISAKHGTGVGKLYAAIEEARAAVQQNFSTPILTEALQAAQVAHQPPLVNGRRIKLRYAHLGGRFPLLFIIHGKQTESLPLSYQRYLVNYFRKLFNLQGTPIHLRLISDANPYDEREK